MRRLIVVLSVLGLLVAACSSDPTVSDDCLADMRAAADVPGLAEDLFDHNQELHPTFSSCETVEEWEEAVDLAGLGDLLDVEFIRGECGFNPGVQETRLCENLGSS
jgi:hypothetical protein